MVGCVPHLEYAFAVMHIVDQIVIPHGRTVEMSAWAAFGAALVNIQVRMV